MYILEDNHQQRDEILLAVKKPVSCSITGTEEQESVCRLERIASTCAGDDEGDRIFYAACTVSLLTIFP